jgi:ABC-type nitrate/sulfonate/bicarbonate transport system permease component
MIEAARFLDSPSVFAGIVEIAVAGFCLIKSMELIRRRLLVWHGETTINVMQ